MKTKNLKLLKHIAITLLFPAFAIQFYSGGTGAGNCLNFDGVNDYINVPNLTPTLTGDLTVSFWFCTSQTTTWQARFLDIGQSAFPYLGLQPSMGPSGQVGIENSGGPSGGVWTTNSYADGNWHNMVLIRTSSTYMMYVDGTFIGSVGGTIPTYTQVTIGRWCCSSCTNTWYPGQIDEVRIWNRALTQEEIRNNMCQKLKGNESGLVGYWRFNEGSGNTVYDASGNGNNGTLY